MSLGVRLCLGIGTDQPDVEAAFGEGGSAILAPEILVVAELAPHPPLAHEHLNASLLPRA